MRLATLLLAALLAPFAGTASGHLTHDGCEESDTVPKGPVHVDSYAHGCAGVTASVPNSDCSVLHYHPDFVSIPVHVLVLWTPQCQTGVIVESIRPDGGALLP